MTKDAIIDWLLEGDISIKYQVYKDLLGETYSELQEGVEKEGWGHAFLACQNANGYWGKSFYQPKWTSTHYTLLDLRNLCLSPYNAQVAKALALIINNDKGEDGGINPFGAIRYSDVCVNGMFLDYASYFEVGESKLYSVVDFLLSQKMPDGGFNCLLNRSGAKHSSLHSTIAVVEGIRTYFQKGYKYRLDELLEVEQSGIDFILLHQLFLSDRTGEIINKNFLKLSYPSRWKYDILRALDYFRKAGVAYDSRMQPAIDVLLKKRRKEGLWTVQAAHPGQTHFKMEYAGQPSRWNTLRALRVLKHFKIL